MKTYLCEEIMCGHCVSRIQEGLKEGGIENQVNLEKKTVTIEQDRDVEKALEILDDLGFSSKEIER